ncbi:MAG: hypothetical protein JW919_05615 [Candidatus Omnitrophica bacterium]|nr:hypothetical protein [Candidatus Omnitrophota bacterium]
MNDISNIIDDYFYTAERERIYDYIINEIEKVVITKALERSCGNQVAAARMLGVHRNTLNSKIRKLNIDIGRFKK